MISTKRRINKFFSLSGTNPSLINVRKVIIPKIIVEPILKKVEDTIAGIINRKQNGLNIPPVKNKRILN